MEENIIKGVNAEETQEFKKKEKHYLRVIISLFVLAHCCIVFPILLSYISNVYEIKFP